MRREGAVPDLSPRLTGGFEGDSEDEQAPEGLPMRSVQGVAYDLEGEGVSWTLTPLLTERPAGVSLEDHAARYRSNGRIHHCTPYEFEDECPDRGKPYPIEPAWPVAWITPAESIAVESRIRWWEQYAPTWALACMSAWAEFGLVCSHGPRAPQVDRMGALDAWLCTICGTLILYGEPDERRERARFSILGIAPS